MSQVGARHPSQISAHPASHSGQASGASPAAAVDQLKARLAALGRDTNAHAAQTVGTAMMATTTPNTTAGATTSAIWMQHANGLRRLLNACTHLRMHDASLIAVVRILSRVNADSAKLRALCDDGTAANVDDLRREVRRGIALAGEHAILGFAPVGDPRFACGEVAQLLTGLRAFVHCKREGILTDAELPAGKLSQLVRQALLALENVCASPQSWKDEEVAAAWTGLHALHEAGLLAQDSVLAQRAVTALAAQTAASLGAAEWEPAELWQALRGLCTFRDPQGGASQGPIARACIACIARIANCEHGHWTAKALFHVFHHLGELSADPVFAAAAHGSGAMTALLHLMASIAPTEEAAAAWSGPGLNLLLGALLAMEAAWGAAGQAAPAAFRAAALALLANVAACEFKHVGPLAECATLVGRLLTTRPPLVQRSDPQVQAAVAALIDAMADSLAAQPGAWELDAPHALEALQVIESGTIPAASAGAFAGTAGGITGTAGRPTGRSGLSSRSQSTPARPAPPLQTLSESRLVAALARQGVNSQPPIALGQLIEWLVTVGFAPQHPQAAQAMNVLCEALLSIAPACSPAQAVGVLIELAPLMQGGDFVACRPQMAAALTQVAGRVHAGEKADDALQRLPAACACMLVEALAATLANRAGKADGDAARQLLLLVAAMAGSIAWSGERARAGAELRAHMAQVFDGLARTAAAAASTFEAASDALQAPATLAEVRRRLRVTDASQGRTIKLSWHEIAQLAAAIRRMDAAEFDEAHLDFLAGVLGTSRDVSEALAELVERAGQSLGNRRPRLTDSSSRAVLANLVRSAVETQAGPGPVAQGAMLLADTFARKYIQGSGWPADWWQTPAGRRKRLVELQDGQPEDPLLAPGGRKQDELHQRVQFRRTQADEAQWADVMGLEGVDLANTLAGMAREPHRVGALGFEPLAELVRRIVSGPAPLPAAAAEVLGHAALFRAFASLDEPPEDLLLLWTAAGRAVDALGAQPGAMDFVFAAEVGCARVLSAPDARNVLRKLDLTRLVQLAGSLVSLRKAQKMCPTHVASLLNVLAEAFRTGGARRQLKARDGRRETLVQAFGWASIGPSSQCGRALSVLGVKDHDIPTHEPAPLRLAAQPEPLARLAAALGLECTNGGIPGMPSSLDGRTVLIARADHHNAADFMVVVCGLFVGNGPDDAVLSTQLVGDEVRKRFLTPVSRLTQDRVPALKEGSVRLARDVSRNVLACAQSGLPGDWPGLARQLLTALMAADLGALRDAMIALEAARDALEGHGAAEPQRLALQSLRGSMTAYDNFHDDWQSGAAGVQREQMLRAAQSRRASAKGTTYIILSDLQLAHAGVPPGDDVVVIWPRAAVAAQPASSE